MRTRIADEDGLRFFNSLKGYLEIEQIQQIRIPPPQPGSQTIEPTLTRSLKVSFELKVPQLDGGVELKKEEWAHPVLLTNQIKMESECAPKVIIEHRASNDSFFSVQDLARCIEETERCTRAQTRWLGRIDIFNVIFEGIYLKRGIWIIRWRG